MPGAQTHSQKEFTLETASPVRALLVHGPGRPDLAFADRSRVAPQGLPTLERVMGGAAALARLREEEFDVVLAQHDPPEFDALDFLAALRAGGAEEPLIVTSAGYDPDLASRACLSESDGYWPAVHSTMSELHWLLSRAIERARLLRENRKLADAESRRLRSDHAEAEGLLQQQRALIRDLEGLKSPLEATDLGAPGPSNLSLGRADSRQGPTSDDDAPVGPSEGPDSSLRRTIARQAASEEAWDLPRPLVDHYRSLLRAYVMMGSGNLTREMGRLAQTLADARVSAPRTMQLHVQALEELIQGLGSRSARHVLNRADLLALEVMVHLAEVYRQRAPSPTRFADAGLAIEFDAGLDLAADRAINRGADRAVDRALDLAARGASTAP